MTRRERRVGGMWGLLVGDALGVPYEFHGPESIPAIEQIEMSPPPGFRRAHEHTEPGTYSDDGAQALCLLASLLECQRLDLDDFSRRMLRWRDEGYAAVDSVVFDVGIQTGRALDRLRNGTPPSLAGGRQEGDNGNGSLMRALPLSLWHEGGDADLVADAHAQSRPTHAHVRAEVVSALYCLWARRELDGASGAYEDAVKSLRDLYQQEGRFDPAYAMELEEHVKPDSPPRGGGSGYVVDCLHSARWALTYGDYEKVVRAAVSLGHDTDTTACVAGGIAGIRWGEAAIPERWRRALRGMEFVSPLLRRLADRAA